MKHKNMRIFYTVICMAMAWPLQAGVSESIKYTYYKASADPSRSLLSILNAATPIRTDGAFFHGDAHWQVEWNFRWTERPDGSCKISSVTTELTCDIRLPKLLRAAGDQKDQFNRYLSALRVHELGHCKLGQNAAAKIDRKILSLPEMSSCKDLGVAGNDVGYQTIEEYTEKRKQYDAKTQHGRTQGAWLDR